MSDHINNKRSSEEYVPSVLLGEKGVYRAWIHVRHSINAEKNNPIPHTTP